MQTVGYDGWQFEGLGGLGLGVDLFGGTYGERPVVAVGHLVIVGEGRYRVLVGVGSAILVGRRLKLPSKIR